MVFLHVQEKQNADYLIRHLAAVQCPSRTGVREMALRLLDPTIGLKGFEQLGLTGRNLEVLKMSIDRPYGMVLLTGPTGSGKTTTLYAF